MRTLYCSKYFWSSLVSHINWWLYWITWLFLLKQKSGVGTIISAFHSIIQTQLTMLEMTSIKPYPYALCIKHSKSRGVTMLCVCRWHHITGKNEYEKIEVRKLMAEFEIKEPGRMKYFLNIEVAYLAQAIFIRQ